MVVEHWAFLEERGAPATHQDSPTQGASTGKKSPYKIRLRNSVGILTLQVRWMAAGNQDVPLKDLITDSLVHRHSPWALSEDSSSGGIRDIQ